jgi:hypothetical protein
MDGEISHVLEGDNNSYFFAGIERERERERYSGRVQRGLACIGLVDRALTYKYVSSE